MPGSDLHTEGWRQGRLFKGTLSVAIHRGASLPARTDVVEYDRWVVCTQDCDLRSSGTEAGEPTIELRAVQSRDPPTDWGVRSRRFRLTESAYVDAQIPRCHVEPRLLHSFTSERESLPLDARLRAFKTWLGLRYDRPAVPDELVDLARDVAKRCSSRGGRIAAESVHDVLMQFDETANPVRVALFAIVADDADKDAVRIWLGEAATRVRTDLGLVAIVDVGTRSETSLALVESSYAADLSQLTWGGKEPTGAE